MRLIRPLTISAGTLSLSSTSVPETPPAVWSSGTTYSLAQTVSVLQADLFTYKVYESLQNSNLNHVVSDTAWWRYLADTYGVYSGATTYGLDYKVIDATNHRVYQSLIASNTGNSLSSAAHWLDTGPTNAYNMFDESNTTQTSRKESITVTVVATGRADAVSILNMSASTVRVVMSTAESGTLYDVTHNLVTDSGINDWYEYFFEPIVKKGDLLIYDLPANTNPTFTITINQPNDTTLVGSLVIGQHRDLGNLLYGARVGIQDYSRKEADDFGNYTIIERAFAKKATFKVVVENAKVDALTALLATYRATAIVWIGSDDFTSTWIYGFYKDFSAEIAFTNHSYLYLDIEGLT